MFSSSPGTPSPVFYPINQSPMNRALWPSGKGVTAVTSATRVRGTATGSVNTKGFVAAFVAVWSTALQQYYVHYLLRKYSLSSFNLLGHTAPAQAATLLIVGPFLDYWLTDKRVDMYMYDYNFVSLMFIALSCTIAIGTNLSQFICIGRFTAVSFQVLGHMKTILVPVFFFFDRDGLNLHVVLGMIIAVLGMIWYGNASSKPGGKERKNYSLPTTRQQKQGAASDSDEYQGKA
ncbi:hypothetical protein ISN44_As11g032190 [Arabidopsis suecica]|uniref:Sugar phosphate transporter domain-containing protein n=1 Tax=Arabidopsis suecica TaxID=45249 RepID=A0A8T1ZGD8_ARASU|nr:hypothetical protein ISN44_As11g032190 [Arabidopsis suecica]